MIRKPKLFNVDWGTACKNYVSWEIGVDFS